MHAIRTIILVSTLLSAVIATCDFSGYISSAIGTRICSGSNSFSLQGTNSPGYEYDAISFNDLTITHGDIQGRVATRYNFKGVNGSSIGDQITGTGLFTLIAGKDISLDGEAFPLSQDIFVGGSVADVPASVADRVFGSCNIAGCADDAFDNVLAYWNAFSSQVSAGTDNVDLTFENGVVTITCQSSDASLNFVNIDASEFNQIIGYNVVSCASSASFVFNILGNGDVQFNGNPIESSGYVVYNIAGSRSVNVVSSVNGNIVAPSSTFNQVGGTVYGQLIAGNVLNVVQINRPSCPFGDAQAGSNFNSAIGCDTESSTIDTSTSTSSGAVIGDNGADAANNDGNSASIAAPIVTLIAAIVVMSL